MTSRFAPIAVASALVLSSTPSVAPLSGGQPAPTPFNAEAVRWYAAFGSGIGKSNIVVAENGGRKEVYLGGRAAATNRCS